MKRVAGFGDVLEKVLMTGFLACSLLHATTLRGDASRAGALARLLSSPPFHALKRVATRKGERHSKHQPVSGAAIQAALSENEAEACVLDSGRAGDQGALASVDLALPYVPDADVVAPMQLFVIVPFEEAHAGAAIDALCKMASTVHAVYGVVSVEPSFEIAHNFVLAGRFNEEQLAAYPLLTEARRRYRRASWLHNTKIDVGIGGPEWGTFLGPKHVTKLSLDEVEATGAFHEVRQLSHGGWFLQLTPDPAAAQSGEINDRIGAGRAALGQVILDTNDARI
jgi:hypothetical protein